jgi:hypothetical protein
MEYGGGRVRSATRTIRIGLTSRTLGTCVLGTVLPTLLLAPLRAEAILLHSHCDGETHVHRLDSTDFRGLPGGYSEESSCCESGDGGGVDAKSVVPSADCDHNRPGIVIAKAPFLATTRLSHVITMHPVKDAGFAYPAAVLSDPVAAHGAWVPYLYTGDVHTASDAVSAILSRNHALLL